MRSLFSITGRTLLALVPLLTLPHAGASAQDGSMKACGEKWQAAKAANATNGATWPKFLAECRASLAAASAASSPAVPAEAAATASKPVQGASAAPNPTAVTAAKTDGKPRGEAVFPAAVAGKFGDLRPSAARMKTCSEQYQANKATDANGGMRWLEKGGGYWSLCNRKLKGA